MTLKNASNFFESLVSKTSKKSEIKIYQEFIQIIAGLEKRNLSGSEIQAIEIELDALDFNSPTSNNKKYYNKALTQFESYLKDAFSLTSKGYYTNLGISLGMTIGAAFGAIFGVTYERSLGMAFGISFGMLIGLIIGSYMDSQVKSAGNML